MGLNNIAAIAFATRRPALVVSNARLEAKLALLDGKIDELKSKLAKSAPPAVLALAARSAAGEKLPMAEFLLLKAFDRSVNRDPRLEELRGLRERWLADFMHKLSIEIVEMLKADGVELLVVGRNVGWKDGSNMGAEGNRRFHATPHALLIKHLAYKCQEAGILMAEQEESYTSKSSFALGEPIAVWGQEAPAPAPGADAKIEQPSSTTTKDICPFAKDNKVTPPSPHPKSGDSRRGKGTRAAPKGAKAAAKHQFRLPHTSLALLAGRGLGPAWQSLHADANGAYNILRKALPAFKARRGLSTRFELFWMSAQGLRPFKKAPA
jgi:IS605 OrfB family transposase